jgi:hypothetical protein
MQFSGTFFGAVNSIIGDKYKGQAGTLHDIKLYLVLDVVMCMWSCACGHGHVVKYIYVQKAVELKSKIHNTGN